MSIVACVFSYLLISVRTNFSLSSPCTTTSMEKQTNPNRKTNKPKREKKKRDRSVLKKKKNPNGKTKKRQIGAYRNEWSSWVSLGWSSWVWVLIGARSYGSVLLWIDACDQSCGLVIGAVDRCCGLVIGAVDRCL